MTQATDMPLTLLPSPRGGGEAPKPAPRASLPPRGGGPGWGGPTRAQRQTGGQP